MRTFGFAGWFGDVLLGHVEDVATGSVEECFLRLSGLPLLGVACLLKTCKKIYIHTLVLVQPAFELLIHLGQGL